MSLTADAAPTRPPSADRPSTPARLATLNPYRLSMRMAGLRLAWDLRPAAWSSRARLKRLRGAHAGEKAVILCNGPSLLNTDFDALDGVFTFGLNKINLLFEQSDFRPSCVVAVNPYVIEQNAAFFGETDLPLFLESNALRRRLVRPRGNIAFLHAGPDGFAEDCSVSVCEGYTVTYVAMQLAFHMGFCDVALVGCDHSFASKGAANKAVTAGETDPNHFHPKYFADGATWNLPDLFMSEVFYELARRRYETRGRRIVNATEGGRLDIFPRQSLGDFLKSPAS